jgi:hypothetical protein
VFAELGFDPTEMKRRIEELRRVATESQIELDGEDLWMFVIHLSFRRQSHWLL